MYQYIMNFVHFELAQESSCKCASTADGSKYIPASKHINFLCDSFLDLERSKLKKLLRLCGAALDSEEFFLIADPNDQCLRTLVGHEEFPLETWTKVDSKTSIGSVKRIWTSLARRKTEISLEEEMSPGIIFHSNVLPYHPYWYKLETTIDEALTRTGFPIRLLDEVLKEKTTLRVMLKKLFPKRIKGGKFEFIRCEECGKLDSPWFRKIGFWEWKAAAKSRTLSKLSGEIQVTHVNSEPLPLALSGDTQAAHVNLEPASRAVYWEIQDAEVNSEPPLSTFSGEIQAADMNSEPPPCPLFGDVEDGEMNIEPPLSRLSGEIQAADMNSDPPPCPSFWDVEDAELNAEPPLSRLSGEIQDAEVNSEPPPSRLSGNITDSDEKSEPPPWFREMQAADVKLQAERAKGGSGTILLVTWKKGLFIQKQFAEGCESHFEAELEVVKSLCHPNIVFSFGTLSNIKGQRSFFMEYMSHELRLLIIDRTRRQIIAGPPFSPRDSVDILSQVAKALKYMHHQAGVNVVHCDLKSANILISKIQVSRNVEQYVAKVTDFGSARSGNNGGADFRPGSGTIPYTAPEALQYFKNRALGIDLPRINHPHKIDVYSFGVVAFEVITGKVLDIRCRRSEFKERVMEGFWRPPLRETCANGKGYMRDVRLMKLIESCWLLEPSERPTFERICEELDGVQVRLSENRLSVPSTARFRRFQFW